MTIVIIILLAPARGAPKLCRHLDEQGQGQ